MKLTLPYSLGNYRLVRLLGQGGFGFVYEAEVSGPLGFVDRVAIKLVHPRVARETPQVLDALADEASLLSRLRHPNIVQLRGFESIDTVEFGRLHMLVLEYVAGLTLFDLVEGHIGWPALSLEEILYLFSEVLDGLSDVHEARNEAGRLLGLVHRDLKPQNLMVDSEGHCRILDFGIAWASDRRAKTAIGLTKGSPPFMSPEQVGGEPLDRRSDLYVVGVNLFDLLCRERWVPLPGTVREMASAAYRIATARFDTRREELRAGLVDPDGFGLGARVADRLVALVGSLLQLEPDDRPATAGDVMESLEELATHAFLDEGRRRLAERVRVVLESETSRPAQVPPTRAIPGGPTPLVPLGVEDTEVVPELQGSSLLPADPPPARSAPPPPGVGETAPMDVVAVNASHSVARDLAADARDDEGQGPPETTDWLEVDPDIGSLATLVLPTTEE